MENHIKSGDCSLCGVINFEIKVTITIKFLLPDSKVFVYVLLASFFFSGCHFMLLYLNVRHKFPAGTKTCEDKLLFTRYKS